jgi:hypothetical protein
MKFGFRKPSWKGRIAARTSWKRYARHNLGLKAPRGWGWLTNPKKAAYNRVYNRTTFGLGGGSRGRSTMSNDSNTSAASGCGCLLALGAGGALLLASPPAGVGLAVVALVVFLLKRRSDRRGREVAAAQLQAARLAESAATQHAIEQRHTNLCIRFGEEIAAKIHARELWQGATTEMVVEAFGRPDDTKERVFKTKTKITLCYDETAQGRYALKIHTENGVVVGWDDNR